MRAMRTMMVVLAAAAALTVPAAAGAQGQGATVKVEEETPGLMAKAKVSGDSAIARALRAVPNGRITAAELEEEGGKLIYSFDVSVPGKPGVFEVHVDAMTGAVGPIEHEGAADPGPQVTITEEGHGLMARAKVSGDSAIALARRAVPHGRITAAVLEEEDGRLIYSFDMQVPGKPGVYEVHVDAITGNVGPVEREGAGEGGR